MALPKGYCRVVCRPNRKEDRRFDARAVGRISRYAERDGSPWILILSEVAIALGVATLICRAARGFGRILSIVVAMRAIAVTAASAALWNAVVAWLQRLLVFKVPVPGWVAAISFLLTIAITIQAAIAAIELWAEDLDSLLELARVVNELCATIRRIVSDRQIAE